MKEDDDTEGVFDVNVPSHDRPGDDDPVCLGQSFAKQGSSFRGVALVLKGRIGWEPVQVIGIEERGVNSVGDGPAESCRSAAGRAGNEDSHPLSLVSSLPAKRAAPAAVLHDRSRCRRLTDSASHVFDADVRTLI
jgi:hypothetical protein